MSFLPDTGLGETDPGGGVVSSLFSTIESYGWFILIAVLLISVLYNRVKEASRKRQNAIAPERLQELEQAKQRQRDQLQQRLLAEAKGEEEKMKQERLKKMEEKAKRKLDSQSRSDRPGPRGAVDMGENRLSTRFIPREPTRRFPASRASGPGGCTPMGGG